MRRRCHHHHIRLASAVARAVDVLGAIIGIVVIAGVVVMAVVIRTVSIIFITSGSVVIIAVVIVADDNHCGTMANGLLDLPSIQKHPVSVNCESVICGRISQTSHPLATEFDHYADRQLSDAQSRFEVRVS